jgi:hypothetical protein
MILSINGEEVNYEVRAIYSENSTDKIDLFISKRNFENRDDLTIDIFNLSLDSTFQSFSETLGGDQFYTTTYIGIPEFGNQERKFILELDYELTEDLELVSFSKDEGVIKFDITGFVCDVKPNCTFEETEYQYHLEAEFDFKMFE